MYKIINSSIKFKDIRYYPFKNIENIAKRLFKKTTKKTIHFTIIFKNNNKEFKYTIKNKKNNFFIKGGALISFNNEEECYIDIGGDKSTFFKQEIKELDKGSEGIIVIPPILPLKITIKDTFDSDLSKNYLNSVIIKQIFTDNYVGKIFFDSSYDNMDSIIKDYINNDIKIRTIKKKLEISDHDRFFSILMYNINILPKNLEDKKISIKQSENPYNIQFIFNNCGMSITKYEGDNFEKLFNDLILNIKLLNNNDIIHCDVRHPNILYYKKDDIELFKLIDFGMAFHRENMYDIIHKKITTLNLYPFEFLFIYALKEIINKKENIKKENFKTECKKYIDEKSQEYRYIHMIIVSKIRNYYKNNGIFGYLLYDFEKDDFIKRDDITFFKVSDFIPTINKSNDIYILFKFYYDMYMKNYDNAISLITENNIDKDNIDKLLNNLLGEDYFKKIDIFYLGILYLYLEKIKIMPENTINDDKLTKMLDLNIHNRLSIDKFVETSGGSRKNKYRSKKKGGLATFEYNKDSISLDQINNSNFLGNIKKISTIYPDIISSVDKKNIDSEIIPSVNKIFRNLDIISTEITDLDETYITEDIPNDLIKIKHIDNDDLKLFLDNFKKEKLTDEDYDIKND